MQPLIQQIFSQIIDSYIYFPQRITDFSGKCCSQKQNRNVFSCKQNKFLVKSLQQMPKQGCSVSKCKFVSGLDGSRVKISNYIQPSNLSKQSLSPFKSLKFHFIKSISSNKFYQINFIKSILSYQFYQINSIKLILSNQIKSISSILFYQFHFTNFILPISFYQFHFINSFLSTQFYPFILINLFLSIYFYQ